MGTTRPPSIPRHAPRILILVILATSLATAGCLGFLQPAPASSSSNTGNGGGGTGSGSGGNTSGSGSGSSGTGGSGSGGTTASSSPVRWTPYDLVDGSSYRFDVQAAGQGAGELGWSVDAVSASTVSSTVSLTLGGTTTTKSVQGPADAIPSALSLTAIWSILEQSLYDPLLQAVADHDLVAGQSYQVQAPGGYAQVTVMGTKTLTTGTCTAVQVTQAGTTVLTACVDPTHGFPLDVVSYDPTTGAQAVHLSLVSYHAP